VEFSAASQEELKRLTVKLMEAEEHGTIPEIFALLSGRMATQKRS